MSIEWIEIASIISSVVISMIIGTWVISTKITKSFHDVDKRIYGLETTVTPYASDIAKIKAKSENTVKELAEMKGNVNILSSNVDRIERELEALRKR